MTNLLQGKQQLAHGEPLPVQIARRLTEAIAAGEVAVGAQLPSEPKLAELFRVSRNTAREAVRLLVAQGILESRKGIGTFVRADRVQRLPVETGIEELTSTTEMIAAAGCRPGVRDLRVEVVAAAEEVAKALELEPRAFVYRLSRVRLADQRPVMHSVEYLPIGLFDEAAIRSFDGSSLFAFLERRSFRVAVARAVVKPLLPDAAIAEALAIRRSQPLLLLQQTHYTAEDRPFLYSENAIDSRFLEFQVRRVPSATTLPGAARFPDSRGRGDGAGRDRLSRKEL